MDRNDDASDVFAIPDFWKTSTLLDPSAPSLKSDPFFVLDVHRRPLQAPGQVEDVAGNHDYFRPPPLLDLPSAPDAGIESGTPSPQTPGELADNHVVAEPGTEDIWLSHGPISHKQPVHRTWATFTFDEEACDLPAELITESSPAAFDALLAAEGIPQIAPSDTISIVQPAVYCAYLMNLALGRGSLLFTFSEDRGRFVAVLEHPSISGFSSEVVEGLTKLCSECGNTTRYLLSHVERTYASDAGPSKIALASAIDNLLLNIQSGLGARAPGLRSLLQLQALVQPVRSSLAHFRSLVERAGLVESDEQILSLLFQEAQSTESKEGFLHSATCEVLRMVSRPWLDFVGAWVGLKPEDGVAISKAGPGKSFVKVGRGVLTGAEGFEPEGPDYFLDEENVPSFMPQDITQEIFETGRNLRFLRSSHPDHPLSQQRYVTAAEPPSLQWEFDWDAIARVEDKARRYELALSRAIRGVRGRKAEVEDDGATYGGSDYDLQFFGQGEARIAETILASMRLLDQPAAHKPFAHQGPLDMLQQQLFDRQARPGHESGFVPHWALIPLLSFGPVIAAQARLVNRECMRLAFSAHHLRDHLQLQRQYHLLGNGLFCSRLSHAIFDSELDTAERKAGVALSGGVMGLRLGGRDNWPPASSELRLALMGVLADSYEPRQGGRPWPDTQGPSKGELLRSISFAVRDLSPEEIERCVDPDSLEALDFLRLTYEPPPGLLPVVTPAILAKYDKVFKFLLRILRMLFVVNQLFGKTSARAAGDAPSARFRVEAHHFVSQLTAYLFETAIGTPWRRFEGWLDSVETHLTRGAPPVPGAEQFCSPDRLREYHDRVLDEIMSGLLLRKRQQPVLELLEDIFAVVLQFAKQRERGGAGTPQRREGAGDDTRRLYALFRKKVNVFMSVCRDMGERGIYGTTAGSTRDGGRSRATDDGESIIVRLLVMLDMSGYYAKQ